MTTARKVLTMLLLLFLLMVVFCFIGFYLGYNGLLLVGEIALPEIAMEIIRNLVFGVQMFLVFSYILDIYSKKMFKIVIPYLLVTFVVEFFYASFLTSGVLPIIYMIAVAIYLKKWSRFVLKRIVIINAVMLIYEAGALLIKVGYDKLGHMLLSDYAWFICSIDLLLLIFIFYAIGGEKYYVRLADTRGDKAFRQFLVFPEEVSDTQDDTEDSLALEEWAKLRGFRRVKAMSLWLGFQLLQWSAILICCAIGNVFIEGLVITASFISFGFIIQRKWHSQSLIVCTLSAMALFYAAAKVTINFHYSQFFPIVIGLVLVYGLYQLSICLDKQAKEKQFQNLDRIKKLESQIEDAWEVIDELSDIL